jgi:hypothetical protein
MNKLQQLIVLTGLVIFLTSISLFTSENYAFGIEFSNYTSEKYKIQFEYPVGWTVTEKTSRFDSGFDISIEDPTSFIDKFNILSIEDAITEYGSLDINTATYTSLESLTDMYEYNVKIIEKPSFIIIDNHKAGTYLITLEKKYEKYPIKLANQAWLTFIGDSAYHFGYMGSTSNFDDPENIEIRDHFIKSIKFIGAEPSNTNNAPSRFN